MSMQDKIFDIIAEGIKVDRGSIKLESDFVKDLNADSLDVAELIMAVEEEFKISIPDDKLENIKTVGDMVSYIQSQQS